ncbi:MAG: class I SAM-dependent methyltransferase [Anaerolineae bacterium]|nr:class I SAM-dependent methyltransferase [Anaerolineae bacterium]
MGDWNSDTAEWYAENYGDYPTNRLAVDELDLLRDAIIVDIGCGTGSALRHASSRVSDGLIIGIDPVSRMIEIAREQTVDHPGSDRIEYRQGTAEKIPIEDDSSDFVFAFDSLDHWGDKEKGFGEIHRILRPDGKLVIVKDGSVPGASTACKALVDEIQKFNFNVLNQQQVSAEGVTFTMWTCVAV